MGKVAYTEYPSVKPWIERGKSIQYVPKGNVGLVESLRLICCAIRDGVDTTALVPVPGATDRFTINDICTRMKSTSLINKDNEEWELSEEIIRWLETGDDLYLAAVLCSNIQFMGEQLSLMTEPIAEKDLLEIANSQYGMTWKKTSQVYARNDWFRSLGLVRHIEYSHKYELTDEGKSFLSKIAVATPEDIANEKAANIIVSEEPSPWALDLCHMTEDQMRSRTVPFGHIAGPAADITDIFSDIIGYLETPRSIEEFNRYTKDAFACKGTSSQSFRSTLRRIKLLEDCPEGVRATEVALKWREWPNATDLACHLHSTLRFVFEILELVKDGMTDRGSLVASAQARYNIEMNRDNLSKRIFILRNAGLLIGDRSFGITDSGLAILNQVSIEAGLSNNPANDQVEDSTDGMQGSNDLLQLSTELQAAAVDSENSKRFEAACASAFRFLGFKAKLKGGPGDTDVIVSSQSAKRFSYRITVDAKSTKNGAIELPDFASLKEHREMYGAMCTVIVAKDFSHGKMLNRADEYQLVLMRVDDLCELMKNHAQAPLNSQDYRPLFESYGLIHLEKLNKSRNRVLRQGVLMRDIMDCLIAESNDSDDDDGEGGVLESKDVYFLLKRYESHYESLGGFPTRREVTNLLEFLSSPMIACAGKDENIFGRGKPGYYAVGSLDEAKNKFVYYSRVCSITS